MRLPRLPIRDRHLSFVLAALVCFGVVSLIGFGYHATQEWRRSSVLLLNRELEDSSNLLVTAVTRDMHGAQLRVLSNRDWSESSLSLADMINQIAAAFALYPYPESFFQWNAGDPRITFFHRSDRTPDWRPHTDASPTHPVVIDINPTAAHYLRQQIETLAAGHHRYIAINTHIGKDEYQVIARMTYNNPPQSRLQSVTGFTVNLVWVRAVYFAELFSQVTPIATRGSGLTISVADDAGRHIWGVLAHQARTTKTFPLVFLDPTLGRVMLSPSKLANWNVYVSPTPMSRLQIATDRAEQSLLIAGTAAFALCVGLVLSVRAVQYRAAMAEMRSEFVSSVTHELKMPLANIRAAADTLMLRDVAADRIRTYGSHLRTEALRLSRLVDNLLAYARITDVANVYTFEPVVPARLVSDALQSFQQPLARGAFALDVDVPDDLPLVRVDPAAIRLVLDNLLDNAIRYSKSTKSIAIVARDRAHSVAFEIRDKGIGIPADELSIVREKFVRGRSAESSGTGLGLGIVGRIVADHGGTFTLASEHGAGTTATVSLPIYKE
jgi:signal transduction histidine kinase